MYFVENVYSEAVEFQHRQLWSCLELFYTNKINSKWNKKTCTHTGVCPSFFHFSASKQTKWTLKETLHVKNPAVVHYSGSQFNTRPQNVFSVGWNLSFVHVNQLLPLFPPCSAWEIIFFVLLDEQKIARTFSNEKGVSNFNFAGMENYIMVKQSGRWLNELNCWNTFCTTQSIFLKNVLNFVLRAANW